MEVKSATLQRQNTEISKQIFPEKEYRGLSPTIGLPILLEEICRPILGLYKWMNVEMNVEIGAEAALFPEKEYISGIFVAVYRTDPFALSAIEIDNGYVGVVMKKT